MAQPKWGGEYLFTLENLVLKDFRVRYRNMSLGILWSLINPLVMMGVLAFVFGKIFANQAIPAFPLFILCGLLPYNFFASAWLSGTTSLVDNALLIKRSPVPRELVPIGAVLSNCLHLVIQLALLMAFAIYFRFLPTGLWLWLIPLWILYVAFLCGISLISSAVNVFVRDTRYVVESFTVVLFWLVPIFYSFAIIPQEYAVVYRFNPAAALVLAMRSVVMDGEPPPMSLVRNLAFATVVSLGAGVVIFNRMKGRFFEHM